MGGLAEGIPVVIVVLGTVFIGGIAVLTAWIHVLYDSFRGGSLPIPLSLYLLTVAVLADLLVMFSLGATPVSALFFLSTWGWPLLIFTSG
ncbi:MAG: hypothetical protein C5B58_08700, partial [Acidobacteria bacterium]